MTVTCGVRETASAEIRTESLFESLSSSFEEEKKIQGEKDERRILFYQTTTVIE